jgi:GH15 family glucan-1,4-alpha-glucosidase
MSLAGWLWLALAAYAVHMLEEYELDWRNWARSVIGLPVEWADFYVTNAIVVVLGIAAAQIGALLMASPVVLLKIKSKPYFRQDR